MSSWAGKTKNPQLYKLLKTFPTPQPHTPDPPLCPGSPVPPANAYASSKPHIPSSPRSHTPRSTQCHNFIENPKSVTFHRRGYLCGARPELPTDGNYKCTWLSQSANQSLEIKPLPTVSSLFFSFLSPKSLLHFLVLLVQTLFSHLHIPVNALLLGWRWSWTGLASQQDGRQPGTYLPLLMGKDTTEPGTCQKRLHEILLWKNHERFGSALLALASFPWSQDLGTGFEKMRANAQKNNKKSIFAQKQRPSSHGENSTARGRSSVFLKLGFIFTKHKVFPEHSSRTGPALLGAAQDGAG